MSTPIIAVSSSFTLDFTGSQVVEVNTTAGTLTVTLPDATKCAGAEIVVTKVSSDHNGAQVLAKAGQTIEGSPAGIFLTHRSDSVRLESDGSTDWRAVAVPVIPVNSYQAPRFASRPDSVTGWGRAWISELVRWSQRTQITPATPTASTANTGGTLTGGQTVGYRITAINANGGESAASSAVRIAIPSGTNTNTVTVSWTAASANNGTAATGYKIYGRAANDNPSDWDVNNGGYTGSKFLAQVGAVTSWTDTGSATPGATAGVIDTTQAPVMVGEIGFPSGAALNSDVADWHALAERMLWDLDGYQISSLWWDVNDENNAPLSLYTRSADGDTRFSHTAQGDPNIVTPVGALYERHPDWGGAPYYRQGYFRGVNVSNGSYGVPYNAASSTVYSNTRVDGANGSVNFGFPVQTPQPPDGPQQSGAFYNYGSQAFFNYLASRGMSTVGIAFSYERLFRTSDLTGSTATINSTEGSRLDAAVAAAGNAGLKVILRAFGNGNYYLDNGTAGIAQTVNSPATITAMTNAGTTVTATVSSTAQMVSGQGIVVASAAGLTNVNGTWTVASIVNGTQFTFVVSTTPTGTYTASSGNVVTYTNTAYANFWTQITNRYHTNTAVLGYYLDNEPPGYSSNMSVTGWKSTAQAAVNAIRAVDTAKNIYVPLFPESSADPMINISSGAWISDTTNKTVYTAHFYADGGNGYSSSYKQLNYNIATSNATSLGVVSMDDQIITQQNIWIRTTALPGVTSADPTLTFFTGDNTQAYTFKAMSSGQQMHIQAGGSDVATINNNGVFTTFGSTNAIGVQDRTLSGSTHDWYLYASGGIWALYSSNGGANALTMTEGTWDLVITGGSLDITAVGKGVKVKEGTNAKQGVATLVAGTVTVSNTTITTSSRIFLTAQDNNTTGALRVSARTAGTSFVITSSNATDTGVVAYEIFEPG